MEHLNNVTKSYIKRLGANLTPRAALRCSKAAGLTQMIARNLEKSSGVKQAYGKHARLKTEKDFLVILDELKNARVTAIWQSTSVIRKFSQDVLSTLNLQKFYEWVREHKEKIAKRSGNFVDYQLS